MTLLVRPNRLVLLSLWMATGCGASLLLLAVAMRMSAVVVVGGLPGLSLSGLGGERWCRACRRLVLGLVDVEGGKGGNNDRPRSSHRNRVKWSATPSAQARQQKSKQRGHTTCLPYLFASLESLRILDEAGLSSQMRFSMRSGLSALNAQRSYLSLIHI